MLSEENKSATPTADSGLTRPELTQVAKIVVVETESPPATLSRSNTPVRQSAQASRLLLSTSRSKKKDKETFSEEKTRKKEENKVVNYSTPVSSLSESGKRLNTQQLLKKEKLKKQKLQNGRI